MDSKSIRCRRMISWRRLHLSEFYLDMNHKAGIKDQSPTVSSRLETKGKYYTDICDELSVPVLHIWRYKKEGEGAKRIVYTIFRI